VSRIIWISTSVPMGDHPGQTQRSISLPQLSPVPDRIIHMDQAPTDQRPPGRSPLPFAANLILVAWMVVGVVFTWWFLSINANAGEWQDLVNVAALGFILITLVAVAVSWLIARYAFTRKTWRVVVAVFGPPLCVALVPIIFWAL
jgi:hypothetical protein